jgi:hypothetical protein
MDFDDLVIGSGLSALGTVLGLVARPQRRIGLLCGPPAGCFNYYDARRTVPCAYLGEGGLGQHWHGVIPTGRSVRFDAATDNAATDDDFAAMFARFYPRFDIRARLGTPGSFVPWRAIRPARELRRLAAGGSRLVLMPGLATCIRFGERGVEVGTRHGPVRARRGWLAAGALHTPALLAPISPAALRGVVSDHVFCYIGQVDGQAPPRVLRSAEGVCHPAAYDTARSALFTLRPAAFAFRRLDRSIEQRVVFGLPTGHVLAKMARGLSPGLLVEAFYNRFGVFGGTATHSVYAQLAVEDAYELVRGEAPLAPRPATIRAATDAARAAQPFAGLRASRQPAIHIPGIHLHHSLDAAALARAGINSADSPLQVVDASVLAGIGPDHHSFTMMVSAQARARRAKL